VDRIARERGWSSCCWSPARCSIAPPALASFSAATAPRDPGGPSITFCEAVTSSATVTPDRCDVPASRANALQAHDIGGQERNRPAGYRWRGWG